MIVGYDAFGTDGFESDIPAAKSVGYAQVGGAIFDEFEVREVVLPLDSTLENHSTSWGLDTRLWAKFEGDLEAGNVDNQGIQISDLLIMRRGAGETLSVTLGSIPFVNGEKVDFVDATQPVGDFVYQIVPFGVNGLQGKPNEISVTSDFYGWWIVDKDDMNTFQFDKVASGGSINGNSTVSTQLNQGRIVIETLSKFPQVYYTDQQYHTFDLQAIVVPSDYSWNDYQKLITMITAKKPLIVKSGSGDIYVCDIFSPQKTSLLNAYKNNEYISIQISAMEIMDYNDFMSS